MTATFCNSLVDPFYNSVKILCDGNIQQIISDGIDLMLKEMA